MRHLEIIVCTHNRLHLLQRLLMSLATCAPPNDARITLSIYPNACADGTIAWLQNRPPCPYPLRFNAVPAPGKSHALNEALNQAVGDWLIFVDDDHRLPTDFLVNIARAIDAHPDADILCGRVLPDWDGSEPDWVHHDGPWAIRPHPIPCFDLGPTPKHIPGSGGGLPGGGNLIVKKDVALNVGFFSTQLGPRGRGTSGSEDTEWVLRALENGYRLFYEPAIQQMHYVDPERLRTSYVLRKAFSRNRSLNKICHAGEPVPLYLYRLLARHFVGIFSWNGDARRYHLVRLAAVTGELLGRMQGKQGT